MLKDTECAAASEPAVAEADAKPLDTVLFVPGLRGHVANHWQTLLAQEMPGSRTVPVEDIQPLSREVRVRNLDREIDAIGGPVLLVAHSAGILIVAHWALAHPAKAAGRIAGALLATPADIELALPEGYPTLDQLTANGWMPIPRNPLPFPAIVAASTNDPLARKERVEQLARDWGCQVDVLGAVGHLNPASGYGSWLDANRLIDQVRTLPSGFG
jgi:predicted alpha/beta hydrolase family esterase